MVMTYETRLKFQVDKDLLLAIVVGVCGSLALAMFFLSGYMVTQSALGAPPYALDDFSRYSKIVWAFKSYY